MRRLIGGSKHEALMRTRLNSDAQPSQRRRVLVIDLTLNCWTVAWHYRRDRAIADEVGPGMLISLSHDGSGQTEAGRL